MAPNFGAILSCVLSALLLCHPVPMTAAAGAGLTMNVPYSRECCGYLNTDPSEPLFNCIMTAASENKKKLTDQFALEKSGGNTGGIKNKPYRFAIVTYATKNIQDYAAYSAAVNEAFAEQNSHIFRLFDGSTGAYDEPDSRWSKVKILEDALDAETEWTKDIDYIIWIDADLIFMDMYMDLDKLVRSAGEDVDIIASAEHAGGSTLINSGTVIAKKTEWSRQFIHQWWTYKARSLFSDQEIFDQVYRQMNPAQKARIAVLPPDALNSDPPAMEKQQADNQVLHLMGEHAPYRIKVFRTAFSNICRTVNDSSVPLPPQLGLKRANLLQWNIDIYKTELMGLLAMYEPKVAAGLNELMESKILSNSVHHYCHGIKIRNSGNDVEVANTLRNMSFWLVYNNFNNRRPLNAEYARANNRL
jgi:hypothetical protein